LICLFLILTFCFTVIVSSGCHSDKPDYGPPNDFPILKDFEPKLLKNVTNGKSYLITVPNEGNTSTYYLTHLWGTAYEMGYAQGQLYKDQIPIFINSVWNYFLTQFEENLPFLPEWLAKMVADLGLDAALDMTELFTRSYTAPHFYDEMKGLADATGADYQTIIRIHMIAGFTQGQCSLFGAWGDAVGNTGKVYQLRALDWDMDGPFRDYSAITVYHPNEGDGHPFVNVGIMAFIGGLTGISATQLGISEIGIAFPDESFGSMSRIGQPFIFLLRDILQYDETLDDAVNRMINTQRTCDLTLAVGDGKLGEVRAMEYSASVLDVFDDSNMMPYNETWHPRIKNIIYLGMDWLCPSYNLVLSQQLKKYYGNINPQNAIQYISAVEESGSNHIGIYDLTDMQLYVSFAAPHNVGGPVEAYSRQFTQFDVKTLLNEPKL